MSLTKTTICNFGEEAKDFKLISTENKEIPENSLVLGSPGKVVRKVTDDETKVIRENAKHYVTNSKRYKI